MNQTASETIQFIRQNDVKFIRLAFCDLRGQMKNISIMPDELDRAFGAGIPFDGSSVCGFAQVERSDLLLMPDPVTLSVLPWRPQQGRVVRFYCDILNSDGSPYAFDARRILRGAARRCAEMGLRASIGTECEFYLFKTDEEGEATHVPFDRGGYLDVAPADRGENVRREICLCLEEMGLHPQSSHHENGPGQNEIVFRYGEPVGAADNFVTFKSVVRAIAARNGLYASFLPKPLPDRCGSGLHLNFSLERDGVNLFGGQGSETARSFIAGVLARTAEITALLNPLVNSYDRLGSFEAPGYVSWSRENRSQLIRIPAARGEGGRMELRSGDCAMNPYLGFAAVLHAGLDGVQAGAQLREPVDTNLYTAGRATTDALEQLPQNLAQALGLLRQSALARRIFGAELVEKYAAIGQAELEACRRAVSPQAYYDEACFGVI